MPTLNNAIIVVWVIFWLYWFISAFGSKRNVAPQIGRFIGFRLAIFIVAVVLFRLVDVQNLSLQIAPKNGFVEAIGFIIFLAGLGLAVWARIYLGNNWGMPMTQKRDPELVTGGPYRFIRHPIYTGILAATLGCAVADSLWWLAVFVIMALYFIPSAVVEEKTMAKLFPNDYPAYKKRTKMLVPFVV